MGFLRLNTAIRSLVPFLCLAAVFPWACTQQSSDPREFADAGPSAARHWYRQAVVDLGARIDMTSLSDGVAISRGMGRDVKGKAYRFTGGQWVPFHEFPYSDFPQIALLDGNRIWSVTHRTHDGAYRPVFVEHSPDFKKELQLPRIMWDAVDFVMYKDLQRLPNGTAWMVGQQGHILYYNGTTWREVPSPLISMERSSVYQGDLNALAMTSRHTGWAVGRDGVIIRFQNGAWHLFPSPTAQTLHSIAMVNDSTGWAVGNGGTILRCTQGNWSVVQSDVRDPLQSVTAYDERHAWIVGNNSVLLEYDGTVWRQDVSLKMYDDLFTDIAVVRDSSGEFHFWIIGNQGIYTTSQSVGVSFTDITEQAGLRRIGRTGTFFPRSQEHVPDLLVTNDGGTSLLYENKGNDLFADVTGETALLRSPKDALVIAAGDVNNDGETDILEVLDHRSFGLYLGTGDGEFRDFTERSGLALQEIDPLKPAAAKFVDLNNDGALDLYISTYDLPDQFFVGDGTGRFAPASPAGLRKILGHASYGAVFADFDNSGTVDILLPYYVSAHDTFFTLFFNEGNLQFRQQHQSLFRSSADRSPTAVTAADVNNDGAIDLYIHSQKIAPMLWLNDGAGNFRDASAAFGFTEYAGQFEPINGIVGSADVNHDGYVDIFAGSRLFLNHAGRAFTEVSERVGIQFTGTPSFADIDGDGDQDLFIGSSRASLGKGDRAALFRNNLNNSRFLKVRIEGVSSNRSAIGTRVEVIGQSGGRQLRMIGGGGSQLTTQNLHELHFGLTEDGPVDVRVHFPSGTVRERKNVAGGSIVTVRESGWLESRWQRIIDWTLRSIRLISYSAAMLHLFLFLLMLFAIGIVGARTGTQPIVMHPLHLTVITAGFLAAVFVTAYEHPALSSIASVGAAGTLSAGYLYGTMKLRQHREAHYIGRYRIGDLLGAGGMGKVYRGTDTLTKQTVAVKVLNAELLKDPENRRRLSAEGHLLASFNHPHIVKVYEIGESEERGYIAMEYLSGGTLRALLERERPLPLEQIRSIAMQICDGVEEVHAQGIIHRDLKSGNVMMDGKGNIRIMDFGLSKSPLVSTMTSLGTVLGTLGYVAPEQVTGVSVDARTDIFSFGVILYEMLTGELPFKGENEIALIHAIFNTVPPPPSQIRPGPSASWDTVVMKCLAKDVNERYVSMAEVRQNIPSA